MTLDTFLQQLYDSSLASTIRENTSAFPWLESLHVLAITLVFGTICIVDLRLLGYASHRRGARQLIAELLPYTWVAFAGAVITGALLFTSNAVAYAANAQFQWKMIAIVAAGINMGIFHMTAHRRIVEWDDDLAPPMAAKVAGASSLLLWVLVIFFGRWIGFTLSIF
ncbi:membrane protein [Novosphingobium barchaimii]|nr:membrane protein [Novosphingobium barchaimii]